MKAKLNPKSVAYILMPLISLGMMSCHGNKTEATLDSCDSDTICDSISTDQEIGDVELMQAKYEKSTKYAEVKVNASVPSGTDEASVNMRNALFEQVDNLLANDQEGTRFLTKFNGDKADAKKWVTYYGAANLRHLSAMSKEEYDINKADAEALEEEGGEAPDTSEPELYCFNVTISKDKYETSSIAVFNIENYAYYGGAHPGSYAYSMTFDKKTGKELKKFFRNGVTGKMQSIIRKGLIRYFNESGENVNARNLNECLLVEGSTIPLPSVAPCPSAKGLVFVYQQYEIAAYAYGMPSFVVPYSEVAPYLTPEAQALLGL